MIRRNQSFTCPNPSCGKVFANPLKTENLGSKNTQTFDACPYCLTEIVIDATPLVTEDEQKPEIKTIEIQEPDEPVTKEKHVQPTITPHCSHQLGYLSKRSQKEKIPEECMMCNSIVQCMLKKLTG